MLYAVPLMFEKEGLADIVLNHFGLEKCPADLAKWEEVVERSRHPQKRVKIGLVGKYVELKDAYLSVIEALTHAAIAHRAACDVEWIDSNDVTEENAAEKLAGLDGIVAPGGYGKRGAEGIILTARYARLNGIPFFAIGYGMQLAFVEAVRSLLGREAANTTEVNPETPDPAVRIPKDRIGINDSRNNSRMGGQDLLVTPDSLLSRCYGGASEIRERHGNRYEINLAYMSPLKEKGVTFPAAEKTEGYCEAIEIPGHPFYLGVIYHPEYLSRPDRPHPLFTAFVGAALHE